jgi:hypothetical protein
MNEKEISFLEEQVLFIASSVFALERFKVLEDGNSVIDSDNNFIFELFPNGMKKNIKQIKMYKLKSKKIILS